jgi:hypothetical protein
VYYNNVDFTGATVSRTDPAINFDWAAGSPSAAIAPDTFSARWTGQVRADHTETYRFYTSTDDGVRLWVNGQLIVDQWHNKGAVAEYSGTIALAAGRRYDLRMDYFENIGKAYAQLRWSSASTPRQIVPTANLFPTSTTTRSLLALADSFVLDGTAANANFGQSTDLDVKLGETGVHREVFLKFDLSSVSAINSAKLRMWGRINGTTGVNIPTGVYAYADTGWLESGITWNNSRVSGSTPLATVTVINDVARWYEWDLTSYLRSQKAAGHNIVSLVLKNTIAAGSLTRFNSDESASNRPVLAIT